MTEKTFSPLSDKYLSDALTALSSLEDMISQLENKPAAAEDNISSLESARLLSENAQKDEEIDRLTDKTGDLEQKVRTVETERNQALNRADDLETELNITRRERDMALRGRDFTPEQKQFFVKLEHESYKVAEISERLENVIDSVRGVLTDPNEKIL